MEISLAQLAGLIGGALEGPPDRMVSGLKGIEEAGEKDVAFLGNARYARFLPDCKAGVVLVKREQKTPEGLAVIRVDSPYLAYAKLLHFATKKPYVALGVHPKAVVEESATLGAEVSIHALAYVGENAVIGDRVTLHPGVYIGPGCKVGEDSVLHPNVTLYHGCLVGKRCIIHSGTVIGADGYSFVPEGDKHFKIPQIGIVEIGDDVELGAANTIDRAATGVTRIHDGVKTDNLVHVAHNCVVGDNSLIVAQVGISGSSKLGRNVVLGGQAGVAGHLTIGDRVMVGAQSGLAKDVPAGDIISGTPAMPHSLWLRTRQLIRRLPELFDRVKALEKAASSEKE